MDLKRFYTWPLNFRVRRHTYHPFKTLAPFGLSVLLAAVFYPRFDTRFTIGSAVVAAAATLLSKIGSGKSYKDWAADTWTSFGMPALVWVVTSGGWLPFLTWAALYVLACGDAFGLPWKRWFDEIEDTRPPTQT